MATSQADREPALQFETLSIHAGTKRAKNKTEDVPIYASTSFVFNDSAHGAAVFAGEAEAFCYSRIANPTVDAFEKRMAALEGGAAALAASSGQAAIFMAMTALASAGSNIVVASGISDTTRHLFEYRLSSMGIQARFVESGYDDQMKEVIDPNTKAIFAETISTHGLLMSNFEILSQVAHEAGLPLVIDNTAGVGGYVIRPIDHGADIVVQSAAEWLSISGSNEGGVIVDAGKFDWFKNRDRFPQFTGPSPGFHGLKLWDKFGKLSFTTMARAAVLRDIGPCLNPFEASQLLLGLETLAVRMNQIFETAELLANVLHLGEKVHSVQWPGLMSDPSYRLGVKYSRKKYGGGVLSFKAEGARHLSEKVLESLRVISIGERIGGSKTTIIFPARDASQERSKRGLMEPVDKDSLGDRVYLSVGMENIADILADLKKLDIVD